MQEAISRTHTVGYTPEFCGDHLTSSARQTLSTRKKNYCTKMGGGAALFTSEARPRATPTESTPRHIRRGHPRNKRESQNKHAPGRGPGPSSPETRLSQTSLMLWWSLSLLPISFYLQLGSDQNFQIGLNDITIVRLALLYLTQEYQTSCQGDLFVLLQRWGSAGGNVHYLH